MGTLRLYFLFEFGNTHMWKEKASVTINDHEKASPFMFSPT